MAAAEITGDDRDQLMREVMAETDEEDRGILTTAALKQGRDHKAFIDEIILYSILSQI